MNPFAGAGSVLLVHAHPDDETLFSGGLILMLADAGIRVDLLTATRGERGEVVPALRGRVDDPEALASIRVAELRRAATGLGVSHTWLLGEPPARAPGLPPRVYSDSGMRWVTPTIAGPLDNVPADALTAADPAQVAGDVLALIRRSAPDLVVSYDDDGGYGHPDHRAIGRAAFEASRDAGVPFAELVPDDATDAWVVDAADRLDRIREALRAHATQLTVHSDEVVHSGGQREPIRTSVGVRLVR